MVHFSVSTAMDKKEKIISKYKLIIDCIAYSA